jgi:hypothetical protein
MQSLESSSRKDVKAVKVMEGKILLGAVTSLAGNYRPELWGIPRPI